MNHNKTCDAIVVGSGPGGSTLALGLAQQGLKVILLEQGDFIRHDSNNLDPVLQMDFINHSWVGGPSKFYGAALFRMRESDFKERQLENGVSPEWPIKYEDLEPYYCQAEQLYKVHGSEEDDISAPPRSKPFPSPPIPHQGPISALVNNIKTRAKTPVAYIPKALDYGPKGKCVLCQHCDSYYCPRDAKMDAEIAALRPAIQTGNVELLTQTICIKVLTTTDGKRATGVVANHRGVEFKINAAIIAVCGNATETPTLLWRSRRGKNCKGLANSSGALGRYMAAHTQGWVFPLIRNVQKQPFHAKTFVITSLYDSAPDWPYPTGIIQAGGHIEAWNTFPWYKRPFVRGLLQNSLQVFYMSEGAPTAQSGFSMTDNGPSPEGYIIPAQNTKTVQVLRRQAVAIFRKAGYRVFAPPIYSPLWHTVGTARMGSDPGSSIVDQNCKTHDVNGLYVIDSSTLPSAGSVNTSLTVIALALRGAEKIPNSN